MEWASPPFGDPCMWNEYSDPTFKGAAFFGTRPVSASSTFRTAYHAGHLGSPTPARAPSDQPHGRVREPPTDDMKGIGDGSSPGCGTGPGGPRDPAGDHRNGGLRARGGERGAWRLSRNGWIAFETTRDGNLEICSMNPDGSDQANGGSNPTWSPDGTRIAYASSAGDIWLMNADGSGKTNLTDTPATSGSRPSPPGPRTEPASPTCAAATSG